MCAIMMLSWDINILESTFIYFHPEGGTIMALKDFLLGTDVPEETVSRRDNRDPSRSTRINTSNLEELAKAFFFARGATTVEEVEEKLREYIDLQNASVVKVYRYGAADDEFLEDKEDAEMLADPTFKVKAALAREVDDSIDADGRRKKKLVLLTREEMKQYFKTHPRRG